MDNDERPQKRSAKSLQANLDARNKTPISKTDDFHAPDEVAAVDDVSSPAKLVDHPEIEAEQVKDGPSILSRLRPSWPPGQKEWIATALIVVVGGVLIAFILNHSGTKPLAVASERPDIKAKAKAAPKSDTVPSTLSGLPVASIVNLRPVTGVMIENSQDARPQSGLGQASVVFEAIAEGGITRFLALFQDTEPDNVGPIRSARPYYAQWALGFDAGYAHVGGSPEALQDIKDWNVRDLDQFYNSGSYHRVSSRAAPHNVYTSIAALNQLEFSKGYNRSNFSGFVRKPKEEPAKTPTARTIDLSISGPTYSVHYDYNPKTNSYDRVLAGVPHIDASTNAQISPKVVIAMVMPYTLEADGYHSDYATIGSGQAFVYQDGTVTVGQWSKKSAAEQFNFTDAGGKTIGLSPGQTWLTAVSDAAKVSSAP